MASAFNAMRSPPPFPYPLLGFYVCAFSAGWIFWYGGRIYSILPLFRSVASFGLYVAMTSFVIAKFNVGYGVSFADVVLFVLFYYHGLSLGRSPALFPPRFHGSMSLCHCGAPCVVTTLPIQALLHACGYLSHGYLIFPHNILIIDLPPPCLGRSSWNWAAPMFIFPSLPVHPSSVDTLRPGDNSSASGVWYSFGISPRAPWFRSPSMVLPFSVFWFFGGCYLATP